jgi:type I restriction enzyme, R subunit
LPSSNVTFDEVLRALRLRAVLPREIADLLFNLKPLGNEAVHEDVGTPANALFALKIARSAAIWFHQSYGGKPDFKAGPFVLPRPPVDGTAALKAELNELRKRRSAASSSEAAKALLKLHDAEEARLKALSEAEAIRQDKEFWESYAAETEAGLRKTEAALKAAEAAAEAAPPPQLELLAQLANRQAQQVELDEATTRLLIDEKLRAAGLTVDTPTLRHARGRPQPGQRIAIAEWPRSSSRH